MLRVQVKKTKNQKIRLEQKSKLNSASKILNIAVDENRGSLAIYSKHNMLVREKALLSVYMAFKKYTKKLGLVWIKPVRVKTKTLKGEKRLGKGKGALISYNRYTVVKAGDLVFELGSQVHFSGKMRSQLAILQTAFNKLPFKIRVVSSETLPLLLKRSDLTLYTSFK